MRSNVIRSLIGVAALAAAALAQTATADSSRSAPCVTDDLAREVCLEAPAERVIALSPSLVELAYAAGAGEALVGAVGFSDYPPEAQTLPRVGDYDRLDSEAMVALEPDL
ncbi:MAG TPA: ABC transporter substrate-binding protein, partial [Wenzhouxiangella sp.]|nr:ABC transporter substrate-binding protein [Wenzhouxiangella sp.]